MTTLQKEEKALEVRKNEMIKMLRKSVEEKINKRTYPHLSTTKIEHYINVEVEMLTNQLNSVLEQQQLVTEIKNQ